LFLAGLQSLFKSYPELTIVGQAVNRDQALAVVRQRPDVILLDLDLGNESGVDLIPELLEACENAHVLIVTALPDLELHLRCIRFGAIGIVMKAEPPELLIKAIQKVNAGEVWLRKSMISSVIRELHLRNTRKVDLEAKKIASLTAREHDIVKLIGEGCRNKQIGERLFISEKTVRHYLTSIYGKLEVHDRLELMIYAYRHGLAHAGVPFNELTQIHPAAEPYKAKADTAKPL